MPLLAQPAALRALVEQLGDGVVVVDSAGTILYANPAAEALFGRSREALVGAPFGFALATDEASEIEVVRPDGSLVSAELRTVSLEWEGAPVALVSLRDVTDRRRAEERERELAAERAKRLEAAAVSRTKSEFLTMMSHELRTPLNAVLGYTQLIDLGVDGPVTEAQRDHLARVRSSALHLLSLIEDVLDLARLDGGRFHVSETARPVAPTLRDAVGIVDIEARDAGIAITLDPSVDEAPPVRADPRRVRQIVVNLLSNAIKFTPRGGQVTIGAAPADCDDLPRTLARDGALDEVLEADCEDADDVDEHWLRVWVRDSGVGIPAEQIERIFHPFTQVEGGKTRSRDGAGVGLTLARGLARLMHGDLTVASAPGEGSTFSLWLRTAAGQTATPTGAIDPSDEAPDGLADVRAAARAEQASNS